MVQNVHKELAIYYRLKFDGKELVSTVFDSKDTESLGGQDFYQYTHAVQCAGALTIHLLGAALVLSQTTCSK